MSHLTQEQRYKIEVLLQENYTQSAIAKIIGKNKSVVCRELKRNSTSDNKVYQAACAELKKQTRHEEKAKKIYFTEAIKTYVDYYISEEYSPEQITGYAVKEGVACVSPERIYQYLWNDKKEGGNLYLKLRTQGKRYRKRGAAKDKRGQLVGRVDIDQRPKIVDEKTRFGDLEIDLIIGEHHKQALLTINDRVTGMVKIRKVASKESVKIEEAVIAALQEWKPFLHTITSDNGKEFACHAAIATNLGIKYFFAKPYHSWERGANENLNGLIRQYFPKKTSFIDITNEQIIKVENKLNNRPRKRFGYRTPYEVYLKIDK